MKFGVSAVASNVKSINNVFSKKQRTAGIVLLEEPMNADFNYFEIKVIDQGMDCKVGIGLGPSPYPGSMHKMPGWDLKCIGYHGDDGGLFNGNGFGQPFGPSCQRGDYMGCGVDFGDCRQSDVEAKGNNGAVRVWFTKNGQVVGNPVEASVPPGGFYPLIGLGTDRSLLSAQYIGHSHKEPPRLPKPSKCALLLHQSTDTSINTFALCMYVPLENYMFYLAHMYVYMCVCMCSYGTTHWYTLPYNENCRVRKYLSLSVD